MLQSQLKIANDLITSISTIKKRKKVKPTVDSNEKLVLFQAILETQKAAELEKEKKQKRAERRAKKAKNKAN